MTQTQLVLAVVFWSPTVFWVLASAINAVRNFRAPTVQVVRLEDLPLRWAQQTSPGASATVVRKDAPFLTVDLTGAARPAYNGAGPRGSDGESDPA